jgi:hypothetical protein
MALEQNNYLVRYIKFYRQKDGKRRIRERKLHAKTNRRNTKSVWMRVEREFPRMYVSSETTWARKYNFPKKQAKVLYNNKSGQSSKSLGSPRSPPV